MPSPAPTPHLPMCIHTGFLSALTCHRVFAQLVPPVWKTQWESSEHPLPTLLYQSARPTSQQLSLLISAVGQNMSATPSIIEQPHRQPHLAFRWLQCLHFCSCLRHSSLDNRPDFCLYACEIISFFIPNTIFRPAPTRCLSSSHFFFHLSRLPLKRRMIGRQTTFFFRCDGSAPSCI